MKTHPTPHIALVGMKSSGKSSLAIALFGRPLGNRVEGVQVDTTSRIVRVKFAGRLILYDTPGIFGSEDLENITRLFLGLELDSDLPPVKAIPFQQNPSSPIIDYLPASGIKRVAPISDVLWVVDVARTPTRIDGVYIKKFLSELEERFPGRLVVAGTHLDRLNDFPHDKRAKYLQRWAEIFKGLLIPVSSYTGVGLPDLELALYRRFAENV